MRERASTDSRAMSPPRHVHKPTIGQAKHPLHADGAPVQTVIEFVPKQTRFTASDVLSASLLLTRIINTFHKSNLVYGSASIDTATAGKVRILLPVLKKARSADDKAGDILDLGLFLQRFQTLINADAR